jgi:hypothetical protein
MTSRALIVAAVVGQKGGGADGDVLIWRSADGGARWEQPEVLNDIRALFTDILDFRARVLAILGRNGR